MRVRNINQEEFDLNINFNLPKGEYTFIGDDKIGALGEIFDLNSKSVEELDIIAKSSIEIECKGVRIKF